MTRQEFFRFTVFAAAAGGLLIFSRPNSIAWTCGLMYAVLLFGFAVYQLCDSARWKKR